MLLQSDPITERDKEKVLQEATIWIYNHKRDIEEKLKEAQLEEKLKQEVVLALSKIQYDSKAFKIK